MTDGAALRLEALEEARAVRDALPADLGQYSLYWFVFDPLETPPEEAVAGDLREDLIEIYEDVRTGLHNWPTTSSSERTDLVWQWRFDFVHHWGRHATAALAAVHALRFDRLIDPGPAATPSAP